MDILNTFTLKSNRQIKINFNGGDLSSDADLLLIKEFAAKIGFIRLIKKKFKTNDKAIRFHKDDENLVQMIVQSLSAYFEDDCADELTLDPVFNAILEKDSLASQPPLSRFFNRMSQDHRLSRWLVLPLKGLFQCFLIPAQPQKGLAGLLCSPTTTPSGSFLVFLHRLTRKRVDILYQ